MSELPSLLRLSQNLGFSPPIVTQALRRLSLKGLIKSPGPKKRYLVITPEGKHRRDDRLSVIKGSKRLLLLTHTGPEKWDESQRRVILDVIESATTDGWTCARETTDFLGAKKATKGWDRLRDLHRPTHLVAIQGTRVLAEWARSNQIRAAFIGGQTIDPSLATSVGIHLTDILSHCVRHLHELGHRRILIPTWGGLRQLPLRCAQILGETLCIDPARLVAEGWVFGAPPTKLTDHRARLLRHIRRLSPTAIITIDWRDYLITSQLLEDEGWKVPRDASLVVLNHGPDVDWVRPSPAHYRIDQRFFAQVIRTWLKNGKPSRDSLTRTVISGWRPGETVGPVRED